MILTFVLVGLALDTEGGNHDDDQHYRHGSQGDDEPGAVVEGGAEHGRGEVGLGGRHDLECK